jgi:3-hydroxy-9,10-secoandrosta-1,3,5(10)-triene-9,17-dione monooxygenase reductase component
MSAPQPAAPVGAEDLRSAAGRFPTGVALITAPGGLALVVDTFISVSLDPPLIAFSPSRTSLTWRRIRRTGRFAVNVLAAGHASGIRERARPGADRLTGLALDILAGDLPVVRDAPAVLLCELECEHAAGDHTLVVGRVEQVRRGPDEPPLVFFGGEFGTVAMPR